MVDAGQSGEEADQTFDGIGPSASPHRALFFLDRAVNTQRMSFQILTYVTSVLADIRQTDVFAHCTKVVS
jgi:hypothetical protein